jgi:hypothetical protein
MSHHLCSLRSLLGVTVTTHACIMPTADHLVVASLFTGEG